LHASSQDGALPSSGLDFLLQMQLRRERTDKTAQKTSMPKRLSIRESFSEISISLLHWLHAPDGTLPSSGSDFLLQMQLRRERTDKKAQKTARKERTMLIPEQAFDVIDTDG
jgi:hypothetical protein